MRTGRHDSIPVMDYRQYRRARRLVHECCNYDSGNCIALDDGEECVCVQSISYSLLCRWFRIAVLPLDKELEAALFYRLDRKKCCVWEIISPRFQPRQILPGMCRRHEAETCRRAQTETEA